MGNRDDPGFAGMRELVVRALDAVQPPAVRFQLLDDLRAFHGGYYNHRFLDEAISPSRAEVRTHHPFPRELSGPDSSWCPSVFPKSRGAEGGISGDPAGELTAVANVTAAAATTRTAQAGCRSPPRRTRSGTRRIGTMERTATAVSSRWTSTKPRSATAAAAVITA